MTLRNYSNPVGIVQGRLSPPVDGMIQAFPKETWRDEFRIASEIGFDAIELIFDGPENPLFHKEGADEIRSLANTSNIFISSANMDYSMFYPLFGETRKQSLLTTIEVIQQCASIGIPRVGISFEDNSSILTEAHRDQAIESMKVCLRIAESLDMIITIETSLIGTNLIEFIDQIGSANLKVNFDTGNSCAYGEDPASVIRSLRRHIGGIHIKDRTRLFGMTVPLEQGDTDLSGCFEAIKDIEYTGVVIIQGARGENDVETAIKYQNLVRRYLEGDNDKLS